MASFSTIPSGGQKERHTRPPSPPTLLQQGGSDLPSSSSSSFSTGGHHAYRHFYCCGFGHPPQDADPEEQPVPHLSLGLFGRILATKFILEVCGAAGAVWGFSLIVNWRTKANEEEFRMAAVVTGLVFAVRFYRHAQQVWEHGYEQLFPDPPVVTGARGDLKDSSSSSQRPPLFPRQSLWSQTLAAAANDGSDDENDKHPLATTVQVFGAKLLLQVCGAGGAIWGASGALHLPSRINNSHAWQVAAWITTALFGTRWMIELALYLGPVRPPRHNHSQMRRRRQQKNICQPLLRLFQDSVLAVLPWVEVVATKFILEVCGATGAIWGCADIATVRDQSVESTRLWRAVALLTGALFFSRWLKQVLDYVHTREESPLVTEPSRMASSHRLSLLAVSTYQSRKRDMSCLDNLLEEEEEEEDKLNSNRVTEEKYGSM